MSKAPSAKPGVRPTLVHATRTFTCEPAIERADWNLPSGESLAEFALRFGFLAPALLGPKTQIAPPPQFRGVR